MFKVKRFTLCPPNSQRTRSETHISSIKHTGYAYNLALIKRYKNDAIFQAIIDHVL